MNRLAIAAVFALGLIPGVSSAVEINNIRPCYFPFGATRLNTSCLPGDVLWLTYDIEGLAIKDGNVNYVTILELFDPKGKSLFKEENENKVSPQLGGASMPGDLHVIVGPKLAPGKYSIKFSVHDKNGKDAKAFSYPFDVVPETFGFVGVSAPAVGFPGQRYVTGFALVNMTLDAKKNPNAEITIRILDAKKAEVSKVKMFLPRDLPDNTDLDKANFVPLSYPIFLNRAGRYTIQVNAIDKNGNKMAELSYPLTVADLGGFAGR
jgi:hypothetical protein